MKSFDDAVEKLLWPEKRLSPDLTLEELAETYCYRRWAAPFCGPIYRTTKTSYLKVNRIFLPEILQGLLLEDEEEELRIGPMPKGTPINLLAAINAELSFDPPGRLRDLVAVLLESKKALKRIEDENLDDEQSREILRGLVPGLLRVSKCPDFVVNRGHEYGADLPDDDKRALIEFLKTL